jgi:hypothetical protein
MGDFGFGRTLDRADLGQLYGWVGALFSGLAFIGVIGAIILQREELQLQRQELGQTREELRGQKEQLEAQNNTFRQQTFENTFFQLLRLHHEIVHGLKVRRPHDIPAEGRECLLFFFDTLQYRYNQRPSREGSDTRIKNASVEFLVEFQPFCGTGPPAPFSSHLL